MFGIGIFELIIIFIIILLIVGPKKLPEIAHKITKALNELKKINNKLKNTILNYEKSDIKKNYYLKKLLNINNNKKDNDNNG